MSHEHIFPTHPLPEQQLHSQEDLIKKHDPTARQNAKQPPPPIVAKPCDPQAIPAVVNLFNNLMTIQNAGKTVFGHHDSFAYGRSGSNGQWKMADGKNIFSDVHEVLHKKDLPAMVGWDLGQIERNNSILINNVSIQRMVRRMQTGYATNIVNTICWHYDNPDSTIKPKQYNEITDGKTVERILRPINKVGSLRKRFYNDLDRLVVFFNDEKIKYIPFIFRPFHEANLKPPIESKNGFWWDARWCSPQQFKELWKITVSYLKERVHNLLFAFSLNNSNNLKTELSVYMPDEDLVDIIGFDDYQRAKEKQMQNSNQVYNSYYYNDVFKKRVNIEIQTLLEFAAKKNKLASITEIGADNLEYHSSTFGEFKNDKWYSEILLPAIDLSNTKYKDKSVCYLMLWRNPMPQPTENTFDDSPFYCSYASHPSSIDFIDNIYTSKFLFNVGLRASGLYKAPIKISLATYKHKIQ